VPGHFSLAPRVRSQAIARTHHTFSLSALQLPTSGPSRGAGRNPPPVHKKSDGVSDVKFLAATAVLALATPAMAQDVAYELINNSSYVVLEFYTSAASDANWGPDLMASLDLYSGESGTVTIADGGSECVYDILIVTDGGELSDQVDICQLGSYTVTD
jgi:hypothetical protein